MSWLEDVARADGIGLDDAAACAVLLGVRIDVQAFMDAGTQGRAALVAAQRNAMAAAIEGAGLDITAADPRQAPRLMAKAAGEGVARALRIAREGGGGQLR